MIKLFGRYEKYFNTLMKDIDVNGYSVLLKESDILERISFELEDLLDEGGT
jgi:hypothetical protein